MLAIPGQDFHDYGSCLLWSLIHWTVLVLQLLSLSIPFIFSETSDDVHLSDNQELWKTLALRHFDIFVSRLAAFQTHQRPRRMKLCGGSENKLNTSSLAFWEKEERSRMLQHGQLHRPTAEAVMMLSCITGAWLKAFFSLETFGLILNGTLKGPSSILSWQEGYTDHWAPAFPNLGYTKAVVS